MSQKVENGEVLGEILDVRSVPCDIDTPLVANTTHCMFVITSSDLFTL